MMIWSNQTLAFIAGSSSAGALCIFFASLLSYMSFVEVQNKRGKNNPAFLQELCNKTNLFVLM